MKGKLSLKFVCIIVSIFLLILNINFAFANEDETDIGISQSGIAEFKEEKNEILSISNMSDKAPEGYNPVSITRKARSMVSLESSNDTNRVLLIQEILPWNSEANQVVLDSLNMSYTLISMGQFAQTDLTGYYLVIVANDQNLGFYSDYNSVKAKLENYVKEGGILVMGACDSGWANGTITSGLPGDVQLAPANYEYYNTVSMPDHPIVTGELTNNDVLTDADLYSTYCSHREFDEGTLPAGTKVILRSMGSRNPTLIEYPYGKGTIIASGLTWEHNWKYYADSNSYGSFGRKSLDDLYAYAASLANPAAGYEFRRQVGIEYEQTSEPANGVVVPEIKDIKIETLDEIWGKYRFSIIDYNADVGAGATPFFFWKTEDGYFDNANSDFTSVEFNANPGTGGEKLQVTAFIGDNLGYVGSKTVEVSGTYMQYEDDFNLEFLSKFNKLYGWDMYEINYSAVLRYNGKVVPGTSVDIYYTKDGTQWYPIVTGLVNTDSYVWQVPNERITSGKLKIVAQNGKYKKSVESGNFDVEPTYYIEGKVVDEGNRGVANVTVSVNGVTAITDSNGYYLVRVGGPGTYKISASINGANLIKSDFNVVLDDINFYDYKVFRIKS